MKIERVPLFNSPSDLFALAVPLLLLMLVSLFRLYSDYRALTQFDDAEINATVISQYTKTKKGRSYTVIRLRLYNGVRCSLRASSLLRELGGREVHVWVGTKRITFLKYLRGFYTYGHVQGVSRTKNGRYRVADSIRSQHSDAVLSELFAALFTATPLSWRTRQQLSSLGISHLLAISGFHFGLLAMIVSGLLYYPYRWVQYRCFPWRNRRRDLFMLSAAVLITYALFLGLVPSVLRALAMLLIGFYLYDRGVKIISMQTLALSVAFLIVIWPPLLFSWGFWLSVGGVFYLFLFLMMPWPKNAAGRFVTIHFWIYVMMLPVSLALFHTFTPYHPLSILWSMGFILFYPIALLVHLAGAGALLDPIVTGVLDFSLTENSVQPPSTYLLGAFILFSLIGIRRQWSRVLLACTALAIFIEAVYKVA